MIPHKNDAGLVEWFEHPEPCGKTMILRFVQDCGFGNQLFEIAAAYGIAKRTGCHLRWSWEPSRLRKFELEPVGFAHTKHEGVPVLAHRLGQGNIKIVREIERRIKLTNLDTFAVSCPFQDEKCFDEDQTVVADYFRPNLPPLPLEVPAGATPVGVQVRRTDYVGHSRLDVVTPHYFHNAMDWITLQGIVDGSVHGTISQQPYEYGYHSVRILAGLMKGDQSVLPEGGVFEVPIVEVRKDNVDEFWANLKTLKGEATATSE